MCLVSCITMGHTSTPFRLRPEGSVASLLEERCGRAGPMSERMVVLAVVLHTADFNVQVGYAVVLPIFVSESIQIADDI